MGDPSIQSGLYYKHCRHVGSGSDTAAIAASGPGCQSCYLALSHSRSLYAVSPVTEPWSDALDVSFLVSVLTLVEGSCPIVFPSALCQELQCYLNLIDSTGLGLGLGFSCQMELLLKVSGGISLLFIFLDMSQEE